MKFRTSGAELFYDERGQGPETIVFSHGLLWSHAMYERQVGALAPSYRCIAYDHRGQGQSEVTRSGYDMDTLAADAAELIEGVAGGPVHWVGLSMGGFVGLRLAARRPELIRSLVLMNTAADPEPTKGKIKYTLLGAVARTLGLAPLADTVMKVMFAPEFLRDPARADDAAEMKRRLLENDKIGSVRATMGVVRRDGVEGELSKIHVPTLVLCGEHDAAIARARSQKMADAIAGARLRVVAGAGHTSTVEAPLAVTGELREFLAGD